MLLTMMISLNYKICDFEVIKPKICNLEFDNDSSKIDFKKTSSCPRIAVDRYGQQLK